MTVVTINKKHLKGAATSQSFTALYNATMSYNKILHLTLAFIDLSHGKLNSSCF